MLSTARRHLSRCIVVAWTLPTPAVPQCTATNCNICDANGQCKECSFGYYADAGRCTPVSKGGWWGALPTFGLTVSAVHNIRHQHRMNHVLLCPQCTDIQCSKCDANGCTQCKGGFYVNAGKCTPVSGERGDQHNTHLLASIPSMVCSAFMADRSCVQGKTLSLPSAHTCLQCADTNCAMCDANTCTFCADGYFVDAGICKQVRLVVRVRLRPS